MFERNCRKRNEDDIELEKNHFKILPRKLSKAFNISTFLLFTSCAKHCHLDALT